MDAFDEAGYSDVVERALRFFLACRQWDGLHQSDVEAWLENFPDPKGRYYALRILNGLLYYSEGDLEHLLREGLLHHILGQEILLTRQVPSCFSASKTELEQLVDSKLKETLFVPLLDQGAPYESGNQVSRILLQRLLIPSKQIVRASDICEKHIWAKRLVIVDDCVGSGDQLRKFWRQTTIKNGTPLRQWCSDNIILAHYLVLVGYRLSISTLTRELPDLDIRCMETLGEEHRVFGKQSHFWRDDHEREEAKDYLTAIATRHGIPLFGYSGMDFAVIMHLNIPDWSLPILWRSSVDWRILMQRKNSNA